MRACQALRCNLVQQALKSSSDSCLGTPQPAQGWAAGVHHCLRLPALLTTVQLPLTDSADRRRRGSPQQRIVLRQAKTLQLPVLVIGPSNEVGVVTPVAEPQTIDRCVSSTEQSTCGMRAPVHF